MSLIAVFRGRLTAGLQVLVLAIGVRIPAPEPINFASLRLFVRSRGEKFIESRIR